MQSAEITLKPGPRQHRADDQISQRVTHKTKRDNIDSVILREQHMLFKILLLKYKLVLATNEVIIKCAYKRFHGRLSK